MKLKFCFLRAYGLLHKLGDVKKGKEITTGDGRRLSPEWIYYVEVSEKMITSLCMQPWTLPKYAKPDQERFSRKKFAKMINC